MEKPVEETLVSSSTNKLREFYFDDGVGYWTYEDTETGDEIYTREQIFSQST